MQKMRKKIVFLLTFIMLLTLLPVGAVTASASGKLPAPTGVRFDGLTLKWNKVDNAVGYDMERSGVNNSDDYTHTWENIPENTRAISIAGVLCDVKSTGEYTFKIRAIAADEENNSEWVELKANIRVENAVSLTSMTKTSDSKSVVFTATGTFPAGEYVANLYFNDEGLDWADSLKSTTTEVSILDFDMWEVSVKSATVQRIYNLSVNASGSELSATITLPQNPAVPINGDNDDVYDYTLSDLVDLAKHIAEIKILTKYSSLEAADINKDGKINILDLIALSQLLMND